MISISDFQESIFRSDFFSTSVGSLTIHNEEKPSPGTLSYVELISSGLFINIANGILKDGSNIYQSENKAQGRISFRRDCDGICLLQLGNRNVLLIIEVKSGFNEIKRKAFEQLLASYVKTRCMLHSLNTYVPADYEEMGILFSYPPSGTSTITTQMVFANKAAVITPSYLDTLNMANATALRVNQEVTLNLRDYHIDQCHVNPSFYNPTLRVKHVPITNLAASGKVNLDLYL